MSWVRVESSVRTHPKFLKAGPAACWLWLCGLAYCQEGLTDGFIPFEALTHLGVVNPSKAKAALVEVKLWDEVDSGWYVHGYLKHNRSASYVQEIREERRVAGHRGGVKSAELRQPKQEANNKQVAEANTQANLKQDLKVQLNPSTSTEATTETKPSTSQPQLPSATLVRKRRLHAAWEGKKGLYVPQVKHQDFIELQNHPEAEMVLFAWYEHVASTWVGSPGADMIKFWSARYDETWPPPVLEKPTRSNKHAAFTGGHIDARQHIADDRGHVPPCRTMAECRDKALAEARQV